MPLFSLSTSKKNVCTHFAIRLENDFIVFRGNDHEASGQLLKGTVVLCLSAPLKVESIHLKLTGTIHYGWTDPRVTATGINHHKIDKTINFYEHRWRPFAGVGASDHVPTGDTHHSKGTTLSPGNYEWPFQVMLGGNTTESVEGLREASITYRLKASVVRGKFASDLHASKRLRIIRTLESSALEFLHAMSVENIWPNKIDYSILIPQKAVVFGTCIPLETRFTPLLKGLELGDITIKLVEVHDIVLHSTRPSGASVREYRKEREIKTWRFPITREEHWQDMINDSGQEGWVFNTPLDLPRKLSKCLQDVNTKGIKIRHKLKLVVALKNPDGHISELRATLPVTIFISPNMPLDEEGNLVQQVPDGTPSPQVAAIAPPNYGEHVLDQLYEDMDPTGFQTPAGGLSALSSPIYGRSRASSVENLNALYHGASSPVHGVPFSANQLTARLQSQLSQHNRNQSWPSMRAAELAARSTPTYPLEPDTDDARTNELSAPPSLPLTRHNSDEGESALQHLDYPELSELSKVPSYQTAVKTPVRPLAYNILPDYDTATSVPSTPQPGSPERSPPLRATELSRSDNTGLGSIAEVPQESSIQNQDMSPQSRPGPRRTSPIRRRQLSLGLYPHNHSMHGEGDEQRRLHLLRAQRGLA